MIYFCTAFAVGWESPERCNLFGLLGNFQRCLQCGSENSLINYGIFLRKYLHALSVCRLNPLAGFAVCTHYIHFAHFTECAGHLERRLLFLCLPNPNSPYIIFPFGRWVAGRSFPFAKASLAWGSRKQGFPDKYARSEARGRFVGKRHSRLTLKPTSSPVLNLPLKTGMIAPLCLRQGNYHLYFPPNSVNFVVLVY